MPPRGTTMHVNEDHIAEIYKAANFGSSEFASSTL